MFRDNFDPQVWIKLAQRRIQELPSNAIAVICDVRFPNECEMIKQQGGSVIKILSDIQGKQMGGDTGSHKSENIETLPSDVTISNNSTLQRFYQVADVALDSIIK
jgi:hypothetical protein